MNINKLFPRLTIRAKLGVAFAFLSLIPALAVAGLAVNEPDRESFVRASQKIYAEFGAVVEGGREMVDRAMALANSE